MNSLVANAHAAYSVPTTTALEKQVSGHVTWEVPYTNPAAVAGTTAVAEIAIGMVKQKAQLVGCKYIPSSGGVTANATNYFTLILRARLAASPYTARALITFAADTPTTDDLAQWNDNDLFGYKSATAADLNLEEGEGLTLEVTKTGGSGLAFPAGTVVLYLQPRD